MSEQDSGLTTSDGALIEQTRAGDQRAFAELWRRHYRSGVRVARQFTSSIDADDLVSEAYTRIYQRVLAGGGPNGAFRPYLYTTIRNLASSWGAASRDVNVDQIEDFEDPATLGDPAAAALDKTLTAQAFRALPERWQSVLWYTEVEGMDPHEVAPILGLSANGVAALSYRAREGLRKAWLQAHVNDSTESGECRWTVARIGDHARRGLTARETTRIETHLASCSKCSIIADEVDEVGSKLALVLMPLLLGGVAGGAWLSSLGDASAVAAEAVPAVPHAIDALAATATAASASAPAAAAAGAGLFSMASAPALVGGLALAAAVTGSVVVATAPPQEVVATSAQFVATPTPTPGPTHEGDVAVAPPRGTPATDAPVAGDPADPTTIPQPADSVDVPGGEPSEDGGIVGDVVDVVTGGQSPPPGHTAPGGVVGVDLSLNLTGTGTPGAQVSLQAAGIVYATTTVGQDGTFTLAVSALPNGLQGLDLVQKVDQGLLGGIVGGLVDGLLKPLSLASVGGTGAGLPLNVIG